MIPGLNLETSVTVPLTVPSRASPTRARLAIDATMFSIDVAGAPTVSSSGEDLKEKTGKYASAVCVPNRDQVSKANVDYERYLELDHQFVGAARKKFIRKCKFVISPWPWTAAND